MTQKDAYLDSSVVMSREYGDSKSKRRISKNLAGKKKFCTEYILTEINRTFLTDAISLHSMLIEEGNIASTLARIGQYPTTDRQRERYFKLLSHVSDKYALRYDDAVSRLQNTITGMSKSLLKNITILKSGTICRVTLEQIEFNDPFYNIDTTCQRKTANCNLPTYLMQNKCTLESIKAIISKYADMQALSETLTEVLEDCQKGKGNNCKILGDTIICLDAPNSMEILSTNKKDFEPICQALNKKFMAT